MRNDIVLKIRICIEHGWSDSVIVSLANILISLILLRTLTGFRNVESKQIFP